MAATIRVWPRDESVRKYIKHPTNGGIRFSEGPAGTVWPFDSFTRRRIVDGDVLTENPEAGKSE